MSDYDPFRAPVADIGGSRTMPAGDGSAAVPSEITTLMRQTRPWVTFLAILGFVMVGVSLLAGLMIAVVGAVAPEGPATKGIPPAFGLVYVVIGGFYVVPSLLLLRYGSAIRRLDAGAGMEALTDAIRRQKSFWRFIGISTVVMMGLYGLAIAGFIVFAVVKSLGH